MGGTQKTYADRWNFFLFGFKFISTLCNITDGTANR